MSTCDVSLTGIPHIGRATVVGALIGAITVAVPVSLALLSLGVGGTSVLAAAHVGFLGGMGYGGMLGAVIHAERYTAAESEW